MNNIVFIDTEIDPKTHRILDIGAVKNDGSKFHSSSIYEFSRFIKGAEYVCGHNILQHDLKYIGEHVSHAGISQQIDTLFLSPLLFPKKPYHKLVKDDKLQTDELNNPLNDSIKAMELFNDELNAFNKLDDRLKAIFYLLTGRTLEFSGFFKFCKYSSDSGESLLRRIGKTVLRAGLTQQVKPLITEYFSGHICKNADIETLVSKHPIALAYALSIINTYIHSDATHSLTPKWVMVNYPQAEMILKCLRNTPCLNGCEYCNKTTDIFGELKRFFGFSSFRSYGGVPLQEQAVKAAIHGKSLLCVFPTGGGKSITFQLPALMAGENMRGLTIVISPLQSLMKDQVDNLEKHGIADAVTINGLMDPIERAKAIERVSDGSASILYIAPETLRSKTIERLLLGRSVCRFVIDEAHCFSSWGQDFRTDYLYIGDFIKSLQEKKNLPEPIPVSCFTATAKLKVIEDIRAYFKEKLSIELDLFTTKATRTNLLYKVIRNDTDEQKYNTIRALIEERNCPTIIYVSRTARADKIAGRLQADGFNALAFHGKMKAEDKARNQNDFISGKTQIMVATSAFGMGVDKKDVGLVIHHDISDSLENYVQEAGRAGRDEHIMAECYVLFNDEDLSKHFILLNQTKLSIKEIQQIWKAVKDLAGFRQKVSNSALEIARKAGWDDSVGEIETRVKAAIAALEDAGYLKREQNSPQIFASSIHARNAQEAIDRIEASQRFDAADKISAVRIIKKLISSRSKAQAKGEDGESRVDYISDTLGIARADVIRVIGLLREEKILADEKDLRVFINKSGTFNKSKQTLLTFNTIGEFLLDRLNEQERILNIKDLIKDAENENLKSVNIQRLKTLLYVWTIRKWLKYQVSRISTNHIKISLCYSQDVVREKMSLCHEISLFVVEYLFNKSQNIPPRSNEENIAVEFSEIEIKEAFESSIYGTDRKICLNDIEDALFYLSKIEAIKIEGGFLVIYNKLTLQRLCMDNKRRYKVEDYQKLGSFYENRTQQIHIVGEYAKKMIDDYQSALQFVDDYFHLNYSSFLNKYFKGKQEEIGRNMTPAKFKQLFGQLSVSQLNIIKDKNARIIVVAAGSGSGKTMILVHKLASLLLMEDVKHEQLLMLTFSRAAATEFKTRLLQLVGNAAAFIEIKTFHSYCFDILGQVGNVEDSKEIIRTAIQKIRSGEIEISRITKTVLVIDEAQDMDQDDYDLVKVLMEKNEEMRVIAVGDDDQNIYEFRGSNSKYMGMLSKEDGASTYELTDNYRSKANIVDFSDSFVHQIENRLKKCPIMAKSHNNGQLKIIKYQSNNLIVPAVDTVLSAYLSGTSCILTRTNEEALQTNALLTERGVPSRLIQSNTGFSLSALVEIRYFSEKVGLQDKESSLIDEDCWTQAERDMKDRFRTSSNMEVCMNIIKSFADANPKRKYKSDFCSFLDESAIDDFYSNDTEALTVSTMHKAKGKEFDNVFLVLDNFQMNSDEQIRLLYVSLTRARNNLYILENADYFNSIHADGLEYIIDRNNYAYPDKLSINLTHRDINLGYFEYSQRTVSRLFAGSKLIVTNDGCKSMQGYTVLKFSNGFQSKIAALGIKGYYLQEAKANFILWWYNKEKEHQIMIVLPTLTFCKR